MSYPSTATRALMRKEFRQLIPLMLLLLGIAIIVMMFWGLVSSSNRDMKNFGRYIPLAIPALFACGAAAIQVSQEREQKTLRWLVTMPVEPILLFRSKFWVAVGCLALVWLACWILIWVEVVMQRFPSGFRLPFQDVRSDAFLFDLFIWHLHSLYVLLCGFYASWRIRNHLVGLIAIVPLAFAPFLSIQLGYFLHRKITGARYVDLTASAATTFATTLVFCVTLAWLARRAALVELSPAEAPRIDANAPKVRQGSLLSLFRSSASSSRPVPTTPYSSSVVSLFWQSLSHNRIALAAIVLMIGVGNLSIFAPMTYSFSHRNQLWFLAAGCLGCCWLGVLPFAGDGNAKRLRFFSDRGVSPAKLWLGRHLLGMTVLSCVALISIVVSMVGLGLDLENDFRHSSGVLPALAVAIYCYFISQWVSHLLQTLPAAIIVAPIAVVCTLALPAMLVPMQVLHMHVSAIVSLAVLWALLPMLSTFLTMRLFADENRGRRFYATTGSMVLLWFVILLIPVSLEYAAFPRLSSDQRKSLETQAYETQWYPKPAYFPITSLQPRSDPELKSTGLPPNGEIALAVYQEQGFRVEELSTILKPSVDARRFWIERFSFLMLYRQACLAAVRFKSSPESTSNGDAIESWITFMTNLATELRKSPDLVEQGTADIVESWIINTITCDAYESRISSDAAQQAIALVTDRTGRAKARRRAVLGAWRDYDEARKTETPHNHFAGLHVSGRLGDFDTPLQGFLFKDQIVDSIAFHSLAMIDAELDGRSTEPSRRALHRLTSRSHVMFEISEYSNRSRRSGASQAILASDQFQSQLRMTQWFAAWEDDALELLGKFASSDGSTKGKTTRIKWGSR